MASVAVFVDDAVRGTLPGVCAKDGVVTASGMTVRSELGDRAGMGVAWLLVLAGPIGWLALLFIMMSRGGRREVLTVKVPLSDAAYQRLCSARRMQSIWGAVTVVAVPVALFLTVVVGQPTLLGRIQWLLAIGSAIAGIVGLIVEDARVRRARVGVDLDASRRWVTLSGVHPEFVAACEAHEQRHHHRV